MSAGNVGPDEPPTPSHPVLIPDPTMSTDLNAAAQTTAQATEPTDRTYTAPQLQEIASQWIRGRILGCASHWVEFAQERGQDGDILTDDDIMEALSDAQPTLGGLRDLTDPDEALAYLGTLAEAAGQTVPVGLALAQDEDGWWIVQGGEDAAPAAEAEPGDALAEWAEDTWGRDFADDIDYPEVYEWWFVDGDTATDLRDSGEIVLDMSSGPDIWGRTCTGQAIYLDGNIQSLALAHHRAGVRGGWQSALDLEKRLDEIEARR